MVDTLTREQRSRQMALVRDRDTKPEMIVRKMCHALGYRYRLHVSHMRGCPDLVFPRLRKVLFVHGCFWHQHRCKRGNRIPKSRTEYWNAKLAKNKRRDKSNRAALRKQGWKVLVVWECETKSTRCDNLEHKVVAFLES